MYDPLGLSIGTANLVAARNGITPVCRRAALTLYPHCAPKIGALGENPNATDSGTRITGFVERIVDAAELVSPDGSVHDPELLLVEALDAMAVAAGADTSSSEISIAVPAHWTPATVQALRNGLRTHIGFVRSGMAPRLVSDAVAALAAVNSELELPLSGVVGLLDFGSSGTYATLVERTADFAVDFGASDLEPVSDTMRYEGFSGNGIDQALLAYALDELGHSDHPATANTAVGQVCQLREQCRAAKERLSAYGVTELAAELRGRRLSVQVTRAQLEDLISDGLNGFIRAFDDMLARNRAGFADLAAVVTVGGGANIPLVAQRLSSHIGRPVLTASQPAYSAASGALLLATRGREHNVATRASIGLLAKAAPGTNVIELPAGDVMVIDAEALTDRELAWSQTDFPSDAPARFDEDPYNEEGPCWSMRLNAIELPKEPPWRRLRVSQLLIGLSAAVAMTAIGGVGFTVTAIERRQASQIPIVPSIAPVPPSRFGETEPEAEISLPPSPTAVPIPSAAPTSAAAPPMPSAAAPAPEVTPTTVPPVTPATTTPSQAPAATTTPTTTAPPATTSPTVTTPSTTPMTPTLEGTATTAAAPEAAAPMTPASPPAATPASPTAPTPKMKTEWLHIPGIPIPIPVPVPKHFGDLAPENPFLIPGPE
ncbi:Hsp70 family protein [Mycobacterium spongiae]|uniref:Hsp70 family protein n=1 Tax=Mycobacterium spongiae TaxID=886343 RepID=A0A975JUQ3_9MYCO|nr:Hsp70 family protein [Mycobacterium spongiae]QUR66052.1 Hsp70 family protein [Mycobacterium spongiae]